MYAQVAPHETKRGLVVSSNDAFCIGTASAQALIVSRLNARAHTAEIRSRTTHPTKVQLRAALGISKPTAIVNVST